MLFVRTPNRGRVAHNPPTPYTRALVVVVHPRAPRPGSIGGEAADPGRGGPGGVVVGVAESGVGCSGSSRVGSSAPGRAFLMSHFFGRPRMCGLGLASEG